MNGRRLYRQYAQSKGNEANTVLSAATRLKKAKKYFSQIKKYNAKLNELGFYISDSYSTICLFDGDNEDSIDSL